MSKLFLYAAISDPQIRLVKLGRKKHTNLTLAFKIDFQVVIF